MDIFSSICYYRAAKVAFRLDVRKYVSSPAIYSFNPIASMWRFSASHGVERLMFKHGVESNCSSSSFLEHNKPWPAVLL